MPSCSLTQSLLACTATVRGLQLSPLSLPCQLAQPWLPAITLQDCNVLPSKFCFPHQATGMQAFLLCCSSSKNIRNSLSRPPIILYILTMSPFIQFFAGSIPWLVTPSSWEGFFSPSFIILLVWDPVKSPQLLETCGSLKIKDPWMKCLSGVRMVFEFNLY